MRWSVEEAALIEVVLLQSDDLWAVELAEDGHEGAAIPVVGHAAAVVTLTSQVAQRLVLHVLQGGILLALVKSIS